MPHNVSYLVGLIEIDACGTEQDFAVGRFTGDDATLGALLSRLAGRRAQRRSLRGVASCPTKQVEARLETLAHDLRTQTSRLVALLDAQEGGRR
jgi:hypothetical protein